MYPVSPSWELENMETLPARDRQDVPILQAIDAKNYKQATRLIDKRLAKKPTDYLESSGTDKSSPVIASLEKLAQRNPPVVDLDAIEVYEAALENLPGYENDWAKLIGRLRWQCVKAAPKNEDASLQNLRKCLAKNDIENAQQKAELWEQLYQTCSSLLRRARTKDDTGQIVDLQMADWVVWNAFIISALNLPGNE
ncbi:hypothetical protein DH86_00000004 [Scytalidium sp. 3C]|nr:hypothetical protein DH86_00000004 [Scytalidium sp. 3C]